MNAVHTTKYDKSGIIGVKTKSNKFFPYNHKLHSIPDHDTIKNNKEKMNKISDLLLIADNNNRIVVIPATIE